MSENKIITLEEFKKNNGEDGNKLWILIEGKVYDVTEFDHPGGKEILMEDQESDRFDEFESIHSPGAKRQMKKYLIGNIEGNKENVKEVEKEGNIKEKKGSNMSLIFALIFLLISAAVVYLKVLQK